MPVRPKKPCRHPGCTNLTNSKFCDTHKTLHPEVTRSASKRGYNYKWQKASKAYLSKHNLCEECLRDKRYTRYRLDSHTKELSYSIVLKFKKRLDFKPC